MRRPWHVHVTLTDSEYARIKEAALREGRPVANFVKFHALDAAKPRVQSFGPRETKEETDESDGQTSFGPDDAEGAFRVSVG